jgi:uncharacterized protein YjgD (DUF1641 family)
VCQAPLEGTQRFEQKETHILSLRNLLLDNVTQSLFQGGWNGEEHLQSSVPSQEKDQLEKIFASYTSDTGLITRIYRKLKKLNSLKICDPIKKWANELKRTVSKEEVQMFKKHMKKCSPSLAKKEMQIKTTLRFYLTPVRIATIKNTNNNKCW